MTTHLVQIASTPGFPHARRVALVEEPGLICLAEFSSIYDLAQHCLRTKQPMAALARSLATGDGLDYDAVYTGQSPWHLLAPIDVPGQPSRLLVSGTGLTHLGSARQRQAMHLAETAATEEPLTDSMKMFRWGVERGRPREGQIGIAPEWFYKGDATILRAPLEPLEIPGHAEDGGEEAELAGVYLIAPDGTPHRIGIAQGNEFSDHKFEKRNYLNLAGSKLRACSLGPELVLDPAFDDIHGEVRIERNGEILWHRDIASGEDNMAHSLANLEHHHFKFSAHRQPGSVHVHFFGADALSFGDGIELREGDIAEVRFDGFGRALRNPVHEEARSTAGSPVRVASLA